MRLLPARLLSAALVALLLAPAAARADDVPVRVRVLKGSRQGPPRVDPRLADLQKQLGKLAYQSWEQVSEVRLTLAEKKTEYVDLPGGDHAGLTLQDHSGKTFTLEVALAQRNTMTRLTIEKEQRIVHQVAGEKGGTAYFISVRPWP